MGTMLVTGSMGQIGSELVSLLAKRYGKSRILATDVRQPGVNIFPGIEFAELDVTDGESVENLMRERSVDEVFHMAGILSALGERKPQLAFRVNAMGSFNVLEASTHVGVNRVVIPSTIGVFGPETPREKVPVLTLTRPRTMYGVTKVSIELLSSYYKEKFGLDVRGMRYPGIISYKTPPSAGTTDYAVDMFYHAVAGKEYQCYLEPDAELPMMYMPDALESLLKLFETRKERLHHTIEYNVSAFSFDPATLHSTIREFIPEFRVSYKPDYRQAIAESWPKSLDSEEAAADWAFHPEYDLEKMTLDMIQNLKKMRITV